MKQEVHGSHRSSEKQIQSINKFWKLWLYHNIDKEKKTTISFLRSECFLSEQTWIPFTHGKASSLVAIGLCHSWEDFKISSMYFFYFVIIFPWKRAWTYISPKCSLCQGGLVLEKRIKMGKVYNNNNTNHRQISIRKAHLSLWFRWAKNCKRLKSQFLYHIPVWKTNHF